MAELAEFFPHADSEVTTIPENLTYTSEAVFPCGQIFHITDITGAPGFERNPAEKIIHVFCRDTSECSKGAEPVTMSYDQNDTTQERNVPHATLRYDGPTVAAYSIPEWISTDSTKSSLGQSLRALVRRS